ncbi:MULTISPECIES: TAXI family TRAP transporter solute-binding subunit [unclassified Pseudarthrobacter]|uniref:TAXI family TRAP transporter solute-binding subunit n=1 Tax=unclassified Pseudarthrobacter TaxID=2647000 RepID=UPI0012FAB973|nr:MULTISPECIES: TAXI family TRAP transporter solute-binding subunit [unclassified Pseudarthrobacter]MEA3551740.1 TAXI family TRAP transporter solute-binding subunit [Pseudarthrobacter sp. C1]MUU70948.1 TAXI family TRAP transporter solute-binding subunit [Pseudarthrobacter sp. GA104]HET7783555.1 TAXI family TRAP transporter solute-binding subunit [Arthrobacter sp.]
MPDFRFRPPSRREVLRAGAAAGLAGLLPPALAACTPADSPDAVTVAGGEPGGFYLEFATLLAASLQRHGVARQATALTTGGSLDNLGQLIAGKATFAVALADAAAQREAGKNTSDAGITALGRVYENYVHCVVRKASGIRGIGELAGRTVAVGEPGSGTSLTTPRLLEAAGLGSVAAGGAGAAGQAVTVLNLGLNDGLAALRAGSVDALFWSGGVPTAAISAAHDDVGLNFLDLSLLLPALRSRYGVFYDRVLIPAGAYGGVPAVWTVGVTNLLLCRSDLDARTVKRTVELLVGHAEELIPRSSLGVQFLSPDSLINTAGIPLHPSAADAYRELHG